MLSIKFRGGEVRVVYWSGAKVNLFQGSLHENVEGDGLDV